MRIFEIVKENVNLREAAELYGIDVNRYARMEKLAQDIERDEDWGPEMFEENEDDELSDDV